MTQIDQVGTALSPLAEGLTNPSIQPSAPHSAHKGVGTGGLAAVLQTELITNFEALRPLAWDWDKLLAENDTRSVHQLFAWHDVWWQTLARDRDLFVIVVRAGAQLVGIAPLMRSWQRKYGWRTRVLEFIGTGNENYLDFITGPAKELVLAAIVRELERRRDDWDMLNLHHIPETSRTPEVLRRLYRAQRGRLLINPAVSSVAFVCSGNRREDLKITKKQTIQRSYNRYCKRGRLELKHCQTTAEVATYLPKLFEQHIARRAHLQPRSHYTDPVERAFLERLTTRLLPTGSPVCSALLFEDQPVAMQYGFQQNEKFTGYVLTFDEREAANSPGGVLLKLLMAEMIERGVREFDFGLGTEDYKFRFANCLRKNYLITVYRRPGQALIALLAATYRNWLRRVKQGIKKTPQLHGLLKHYRQLRRRYRC